jgi:putative restriction endonuclease
VLSELDDLAFRELAFAWLRARMIGQDLFTRDDLAHFPFEDAEWRLIGPFTGIWKVTALSSAAISISTAFVPNLKDRPYADEVGDDYLLRYKWRGDDPQQADNVSLRRAMHQGLPLIWFVGQRYVPGTKQQLYFPQFPVTIVAEEPEHQQFVVKVDAEQMLASPNIDSGNLEITRKYNERIAKVRLHQPLFRAAVLDAYERRCAVCGLPFPELLDAAHIKADSQGGAPAVPNGLALCKIHHGAFDANIIGISPNYGIRVRESVLETFDGPTLQYAIKAMDGEQLRKVPQAPSERPDRDLLAERFEAFEAAS